MEWFEIVAMIIACIPLFLIALFSLGIVIEVDLRLEICGKMDSTKAGILAFVIFIITLAALVILIEMMIGG